MFDLKRQPCPFLQQKDAQKPLPTAIKRNKDAKPLRSSGKPPFEMQEL